MGRSDREGGICHVGALGPGFGIDFLGGWCAAGGSDDRSIRVWDATTGALLRTLEEAHGAKFSVFQVQFSPTENRILASTVLVNFLPLANSTARVKLWDVDNGKMISSFEGRSSAVFSPDGRTIATVTPMHPYSIFQIHKVESGEVVVRIAGEVGWVCHGSFSVEGSKLAWGSNDGTCRVFNSSTGEVLHNIRLGATLPPYFSQVSSVAWGRDWEMDTERAMAIAMGHHPRSGAGSQVQGLDVELVRMIVDLA